MKQRRRLITLVMALSALFLVGAGPASATHTADHTADEIAEVVDRARNDSHGIVSGLATQISQLSEEGSVDDAGDDALAAVDSVWSEARTAVDTLTALYPGDLGLIGGDAKQQLQDIRQTARTTISGLVDGWTPPAAVTTTSTTTTTTTTPAAAEPPPGNEPGSNSGNTPKPRPESPEVTEDSAPEPDRPTQPAPALGPLEPLNGSSSALVLELAALTPDQPFTVSPEAIKSLMAAQDTGATATMAAMLDTVLSPAVVDLVLSPLLVLEILIRTLVDGGVRFIGPLTLFAVSAMALFAYDRFSRRNLVIDRF